MNGKPLLPSIVYSDHHACLLLGGKNRYKRKWTIHSVISVLTGAMLSKSSVEELTTGAKMITHNNTKTYKLKKAL